MTVEKERYNLETYGTEYPFCGNCEHSGDNQHIRTFSNDMLEDYLSKSKKIDQTELPAYFYYYNVGILVYEPNY